MGRTTTTISAPWSGQQPFLTSGFNAAQSMFNNPYFYQQPQFSGNASFSPYQTQALGQIANIANQRGPDVNSTARAEAMKTLGGGYLGSNGNPYLDAIYNRAKQDFLVPQNLGAEGMGRTGSGLASQAAANGLMQATDASYGANYNAERDRMMQMAGMAPQIADTAYADPRMLLAAGNQVQQQGQNEINDAMTRFNYAQNRPWDMFSNYMNGVGGAQFGGSQTTRAPKPDLLSQIFGGVLGTAGVLNGFGVF